MKTWQWSLLCVLFCVVGLNSVVYAWTWPPITLSVNGEDMEISRTFGSDVQVSSDDHVNPSIVSTPEGHLYAAYENKANGKVMIAISYDGGQTWKESTLSFIESGTTDPCNNPSITYFEKDMQKWLFIVCTVHSSSSAQILFYRVRLEPIAFPRIETIATVDRDPSVQIYPEICTDYPLETSNPSLYVTYSSGEPQDGSFVYPVTLLRSSDLGQMWSELPLPSGWQWRIPGIDQPKRPDIEYGTAGLFLVYHQRVRDGDKIESEVIIHKSTDKGDTWESPFYVEHSPDEPLSFPRVTAAIDNYSVLVAYTTGFLGSRDIQYAYTMNGGLGSLWETDQPLASTSVDEHSVELGRSKTGETFYAAYWAGTNTVRGDIHYTFAKTTEPWSWMSSTVVNDARTVSGLYSKPSIHFDPIGPEQGAAIAWTDNRSGTYQIYFDSTSTTVNYWSWIPEMATVTYSMTVENIFENLNILTVTNQLSDLVTYTSGAVALNGVVQESLMVTGGLWTYTADDLAYGDLLTFSFDVVVDAGVDPGDLISNLINVQYVYGLSNTLLEYSREVVIYVEAIPEPATWALLGLGLLGGVLLLRHKRRVRNI